MRVGSPRAGVLSRRGGTSACRLAWSGDYELSSKKDDLIIAPASRGEGLLQRVMRLIGLRGPGLFRTSSDVLDHYVATMPSHQNAIDSVPGWAGAMPLETGLIAGKAAFYADARLHWLLSGPFDVSGKSVLGAWSAGRLPPRTPSTISVRANIDAIEANTLAFVRCLITKEILKLDRANFYLGDFNKWLEATDKRYQLILASGVLYHSHDPIHLLELIASKADSVYLWTHYFDDTAMPKGDLRRTPFSEKVEVRHSHGIDVRLHERSYYKAWRDPAFCGGIQDRHFWIDRSDILQLLNAFGFDRIEIEHDLPTHENGPSFSVFAQRTGAVRAGEIAATHAVPADMSQAEIETDPSIAVDGG